MQNRELIDRDKYVRIQSRPIHAMPQLQLDNASLANDRKISVGHMKV